MIPSCAAALAIAGAAIELLLDYRLLARRYWFSIPFRGILAVTALYAGALFNTLGGTV